jgi:serine/threonine protein kinase
VLIQVCGALHEAHLQGIIHRDLKPENIFLSTNGGLKDYPKVLDFGLAKVTEREMRPGSIMLTQEGMVFGTPEFMSPEQAQGKPLDARSDIYSLAVILYEVLTGQAALRRQDADGVHPDARHEAADPAQRARAGEALRRRGSGRCIAQGAAEAAGGSLRLGGGVRAGAEALRDGLQGRATRR